MVMVDSPERIEHTSDDGVGDGNLNVTHRGDPGASEFVMGAHVGAAAAAIPTGSNDEVTVRGCLRVDCCSARLSEISFCSSVVEAEDDLVVS